MMDPADDPSIPDHTVWAMHIVIDGNKLMHWGMNTEDSPAKKQFLQHASQAATELGAALAEIAAGGNRQAMQDRIQVAIPVIWDLASFEMIRRSMSRDKDDVVGLAMAKALSEKVKARAERPAREAHPRRWQPPRANMQPCAITAESDPSPPIDTGTSGPDTAGAPSGATTPPTSPGTQPSGGSGSTASRSVGASGVDTTARRKRSTGTTSPATRSLVSAEGTVAPKSASSPRSPSASLSARTATGKSTWRPPRCAQCKQRPADIEQQDYEPDRPYFCSATCFRVFRDHLHGFRGVLPRGK